MFGRRSSKGSSKGKAAATGTVSETVKDKLKWIELVEIKYKDPNDPKGRERRWECAKRTTTTKEGIDAVIVVAVLRSKSRVILLSQYRPPIDAVSLEFPAGLVDPGEDAGTAALRELKEETGYVGKVTQVEQQMSSDAGMTNSLAKFVFVDVDESITPKPNHQDSEFMKVHLVELKSMHDTVMKMTAGGKMMADARVLTYALGLKHAASLLK